MQIILKHHLLMRLSTRKFPKGFPKLILQTPDEKYFDPIRNHNIAIKKLPHHGKLRIIVIVYDIIDSVIEVITIYPASLKEIRNRIKGQRWIK